MYIGIGTIVVIVLIVLVILMLRRRLRYAAASARSIWDEAPPTTAPAASRERRRIGKEPPFVRDQGVSNARTGRCATPAEPPEVRCGVWVPETLATLTVRPGRRGGIAQPPGAPGLGRAWLARGVPGRAHRICLGRW